MKYIYILSIVILSIGTVHSEKLSLLLDWYMNPNHAPLFVAQKVHFFEKHGLEVEITTPPDLHTPPKFVAVKKADLALTYQYHLHIFADQNLPLVRIATLIETPLNSLAVKEGSPIETIADLRGKKIGYSVGLGSSQAFLSALLKGSKVSKEDVTLIRSSHSLMTPFLAGELDAITGVYRNVEPFFMSEKGQKLRLFHYEEHGVPPFDELIIVAHKDAINDSKLKRFVLALEEASQYLVNHRDVCLSLFKEAHPEQKGETISKIWEETIPRFALRPGVLDEYRYQRFAQFLKNEEVIKTLKPVLDYARDIRKD